MNIRCEKTRGNCDEKWSELHWDEVSGAICSLLFFQPRLSCSWWSQKWFNSFKLYHVFVPSILHLTFWHRQSFQSFWGVISSLLLSVLCLFCIFGEASPLVSSSAGGVARIKVIQLIQTPLSLQQHSQDDSIHNTCNINLKMKAMFVICTLYNW